MNSTSISSYEGQSYLHGLQGTVTFARKINQAWNLNAYYAIIHHKLGEIDDGSPIPSTTRSAVYVRPITVPPIHEQNAIASILGALDDKIDLNRRMNETLEAMARAIFEDWFVDFGPTCGRMEGRPPYLAPEIWALFPNRLDDEGKPEGWSVGNGSEFKRDAYDHSSDSSGRTR